MQCPACSGKDILSTKWKHGKCTLVHCRACGLEFWDPIHNPGSDWYASGLTEFVYLKPVGTPHIGVKKFLRDMPARGGRLLDVGCGVGDFCHMASEAGYKVTGIDFTREYIEAGLRRFPGLDLQNISSDEYMRQHPNEKFDVLTMIQVLEHVEDPKGFISSVKKLLKPGGYLMCNVPNRRRWRLFSPPMREDWDLPPHHLSWWDPPTLAGFFESAGFSVTTLEEDSVTAFDCAYLISENHTLHKIIERTGRAVLGGAIKKAVASSEPAATPKRTRALVRFGYGFYSNALPMASGIITAPLVPLLRKRGASIYLLARLEG